MCHGSLYMHVGSNVDSRASRMNWSTNRMIFRTSVVFFRLLARNESEIKIFTRTIRTNVTVNITKVVINILQGSAVTETVYGRIIICCHVAHLSLYITIYLLQIMTRSSDMALHRNPFQRYGARYLHIYRCI